MRARIRAVRPGSSSGDRGFSLIELIVAFSIFAVFLAVFIAGIVQLTRTTASATARIESSTTVGLLYQRIDPTVRFSQEINAPGVGGGGRSYVEYYSSASVTADVRNSCTQLRYDPVAATIAMRRWSWAGSSSHQDPGADASWQTIAVDVLPGGDGAPATYPFARIAATVDTPYQRLVLALRVGAEAYGSETTSTNTFIARNSTTLSATNTGGQVCDGGGTVERP
jgi:prepilin-type N-terminal cleavage/methylation domain-containing protein